MSGSEDRYRVRRTLFDERCERAYVAILLRKLGLTYPKLLFLLFVRSCKTFIVLCVDARRIVAHDGLDVLILRLLLQVLHLELPQECLKLI